MKYVLMLVFLALGASVPALGQYSGGVNDGVSIVQSNNLQQFPAIYGGGVNDGQSASQSQSLNGLPGIYTGGSHDGVAMNQAKGTLNTLPGIYAGGSDDGVSMSNAVRQHALPGIYTGGSDDGVAYASAASQHAGPAIYLGGPNDGIDVFSAKGRQHALPAIYAGGAEDGYAIAVSLNQNANTIPPEKDAHRATTLLQLSGAWFNDDAVLGWEITPSSELAHFELERSTDGGLHFSKLAEIQPNAEPAQLAYRYTDMQAYHLPADFLLYRLKCVDRKGEFRYSAIVRLTSDRSAPVIVAYPNPTSGKFTLAMLNVTDTRGYGYVLSTSQGTLLKRGEITEPKVSFDLGAYAAGSYHLFIFKGGKAVQHFTILLTQ